MGPPQVQEKEVGNLLGSVQKVLMLIRILSWNVRGINDKDKRKVVKAFLRLQRADLVCLQETKCKLMLDLVVRSLGFGRFVNWGSVHSRGQAGGILVFWDWRVLELLEMETG